MLTRLDHALVIAPLGCFAIYEMQREGKLRAALPLVFVPLTVLLFYFASNWLWLGHALPISAAIKTQSDLPFNLNMWLADRGVAALGLATWMLLIGLGWWTRMGTSGDRSARLLFYWALGNALYVVFLVLSVRWVISNWYFVSPLLLLILVVDWMVRQIQERSKVVGYFAIAGLLLVVAQSEFARFTRLGKREGTFAPEVVAAATWCDQNLPSDAVIGIADAGFFGYHAKRTVLNLDGLVNSWSFVENGRAGAGVAQLRKQGLTHVATVFGDQLRLNSGSFSYRLPAAFAVDAPGNVFHGDTSQTVYRANYGAGTSFRGEIVIWKDL